MTLTSSPHLKEGAASISWEVLHHMVAVTRDMLHQWLVTLWESYGTSDILQDVVGVVWGGTAD